MEKMYLVSEQELKKINRPEPSPPASTKSITSTLDDEMSAILNSNSPHYEKMQRYNQVLMQYLTFNKKEEQKTIPFRLQVESDEDPIQDIVKFIPSPYQKSAENILQEMTKNPNLLNFNDRGEISINDRVIPQTNIVDLLKKVLIKAKTKYNPSGLDEFIQGLQQMNIPKSILNLPEITAKYKTTPKINLRYILPEMTHKSASIPKISPRNIYKKKLRTLPKQKKMSWAYMY